MCVCVLCLRFLRFVTTVLAFRPRGRVACSPSSTPAPHGASDLDGIFGRRPLGLLLLFLLDHLDGLRAQCHIWHIWIGHWVRTPIQCRLALGQALERWQRGVLLLMRQIRVAKLATLLRRYLVAVAHLMDAQCPLEIEEAITELALLGIRIGSSGNRCAALAQMPIAEAHLEIIVVRAPVRTEQRLDVERRSTWAAAIGGTVNVLDAQLAATMQGPLLLIFVL